VYHVPVVDWLLFQLQWSIQSNEFRRALVILYARISISKHSYTNWLTSSSSQVSVEINQNFNLGYLLPATATIWQLYDFNPPSHSYYRLSLAWMSGTLAWYNVVITSHAHSSVKYSQPSMPWDGGISVTPLPVVSCQTNHRHSINIITAGRIAFNAQRCDTYSNSVCPSHAGTLSRRMKIGSCGLHSEVAKALCFYDTKNGCWRRPLPPKICAQSDPPPSKFDQYLLVTSQP